MAMNTYMSFLMHSTDGGSTWTDLVPIKDYPDFLNNINTIDVTNLQNANRTRIFGIGDNGDSLDFTCNYDLADYQALRALDDGTEKDLAIWFGGQIVGSTVTPTGVDGIWSFKGLLKVGVVGKGVDEAREMTVHIAVSSDMTFSVGVSA